MWILNGDCIAITTQCVDAAAWTWRSLQLLQCRHCAMWCGQRVVKCGTTVAWYWYVMPGVPCGRCCRVWSLWWVWCHTGCQPITQECHDTTQIITTFSTEASCIFSRWSNKLRFFLSVTQNGHSDIVPSVCAGAGHPIPE